MVHYVTRNEKSIVPVSYIDICVAGISVENWADGTGCPGSSIIVSGDHGIAPARWGGVSQIGQFFRISPVNLFGMIAVSSSHLGSEPALSSIRPSLPPASAPGILAQPAVIGIIPAIDYNKMSSSQGPRGMDVDTTGVSIKICINVHKGGYRTIVLDFSLYRCIAWQVFPVVIPHKESPGEPVRTAVATGGHISAAGNVRKTGFIRCSGRFEAVKGGWHVPVVAVALPAGDHILL